MKVFVYGTLREGEANAYLLDGAVKLGTERLAGNYLLYDLGAYPAAVVVSGDKEGADSGLVGEIYEINEDILGALDWLEEYPVEYTRIEVRTLQGVAWIYLYNHSVEGLPVIDSGDWCQRKLTF